MVTLQTLRANKLSGIFNQKVSTSTFSSTHFGSGGAIGIGLGLAVVLLLHLSWPNNADIESIALISGGDRDSSVMVASDLNLDDASINVKTFEQKIEAFLQTISSVRSHFRDQGFQTFKRILEVFQDPVIQDALLSLIVDQSVELVGYRESFDQILRDALPEQVQDRMLRILVGSWASHSPNEALEHLTQTRYEPLVSVAQRVLAEIWLEHDPEELLSNLDLFDDSVRVAMDTETKVAIARRYPKKAIHDLLPSLSGSHLESTYLREVAQNLAKTDVDEAIELVLSNNILPQESNLGYSVSRLNVLSDVLRFVAQSEPVVALKKALEIDLASENSVGPEAAVIGEVAQVDLDQAISMLAHARGQATQLAAMAEIGIVCVREELFDQVVEIGESLSSDAREKYYNNLLYRWSVVSMGSLYDRLPSLPRDQRSTAAFILLSSNYGIPLLNESQKSTLDVWLEEQDRQRLTSYRLNMNALRKQFHQLNDVSQEDFMKFVYFRSEKVFLDIMGRVVSSH